MSGSRDRARPSRDPFVGGVGEVGGSFPLTIVPSDWSADLSTEIYGYVIVLAGNFDQEWRSKASVSITIFVNLWKMTRKATRK